MAFFSFNSTESGPRFTSIPSEIIYLPPHDPAAKAGESSTASSDNADGQSTAGRLPIDVTTTLTTLATHDEFASAERFSLGTTGGSFTQIETTPSATFAAVQSQTDGGSYAWTSAASEPQSEGTFSAVLLPVPEPSTWAMLVSGAGVLLATMRRQKRRR